VLVSQGDELLPLGKARIVDICVERGQEFVLVNWYISDGTLVPALPYNMRSVLLNHQEVVQTNALEWVVSSRVENICFVFHYDTINNGAYDCFGISSAPQQRR
jgi:hypothetical protein